MDSQNPTRYTLLGEESSEKPICRRVPFAKTHAKTIVIILASCILSLAVLVAIGVATWNIVAPRSRTASWTQHNSAPTSCGSTREEALSAGCRFDVMSFSWLPLDCYDEELITEFEARGPWQWFMDRQGHQVAPEDQVRQGLLNRLYVTWEFHRLHCTFQWKKMHRAILAGRPLDSYIGNLSHTQHCENMLMTTGIPLNSTGTDIFIKFPACGLN